MDSSFLRSEINRLVDEASAIYADIQYLVSGREIIYYRPADSLVPKTAYDAAKDATYYEDADDRPLHLGAGDFVLFLPQDGHKPSCLWGSPSPVRKVVMNIRLGNA